MINQGKRFSEWKIDGANNRQRHLNKMKIKKENKEESIRGDVKNQR